MRYLLAALVVVGTLSGCMPIQPATADEGAVQSAPSDEEVMAQIIALEMGTSDHLRAHDVDAARAETAEDMIFITSNGDRVGRSDYLEFVADTSFEFGGNVMGSVEVILISPDAALVVYTNDPTSMNNGVSQTSHEYVSSLWQKQNGVWQNTFLQASPR